MSEYSERISNALGVISKAVKMSLATGREIQVAFSGGKDSIVLYALAKAVLPTVKAVYAVTTIDPPELLKFIKQAYPEVIWQKPKMSIFKLSEKNGILPNQTRRFCCSEFKEVVGTGKIVMTGVRREESVKRSKRKAISVHKNKKAIFETDEYSDEILTYCISGKEKIVVNPIINLTEKDVWRYISENNLPYPVELYKKNKRVGCLMCPLKNSKSRIEDAKEYPYFAKRWLETIINISKQKSRKGSIWNNAPSQVFEYWLTWNKGVFNEPLFNVDSEILTNITNGK